MGAQYWIVVWCCASVLSQRHCVCVCVCVVRACARACAAICVLQCTWHVRHESNTPTNNKHNAATTTSNLPVTKSRTPLQLVAVVTSSANWRITRTAKLWGTRWCYLINVAVVKHVWADLTAETLYRHHRHRVVWCIAVVKTRFDCVFDGQIFRRFISGDFHIFRRLQDIFKRFVLLVAVCCVCVCCVVCCCCFWSKYLVVVEAAQPLFRRGDCHIFVLLKCLSGQL